MAILEEEDEEEDCAFRFAEVLVSRLVAFGRFSELFCGIGRCCCSGSSSSSELLLYPPRRSISKNVCGLLDDFNRICGFIFSKLPSGNRHA